MCVMFGLLFLFFSNPSRGPIIIDNSVTYTPAPSMSAIISLMLRYDDSNFLQFLPTPNCTTCCELSNKYSPFKVRINDINNNEKWVHASYFYINAGGLYDPVMKTIVIIQDLKEEISLFPINSQQPRPVNVTGVAYANEDFPQCLLYNDSPYPMIPFNISLI